VKTLTEQLIKRSRAAQILDKTPRTLARYEALGVLTPIKLNCRATAYRLADVEALASGQVQITAPRPGLATPRTKSGQFGSRHQAPEPKEVA